MHTCALHAMTSDWIADCDVIAASIAAIGSLIAMCIPHSDKIAVWLVQSIIIKSQLQMTKNSITDSNYRKKQIEIINKKKQTAQIIIC